MQFESSAELVCKQLASQLPSQLPSQFTNLTQSLLSNTTTQTKTASSSFLPIWLNLIKRSLLINALINTTLIIQLLVWNSNFKRKLIVASMLYAAYFLLVNVPTVLITSAILAKCSQMAADEQRFADISFLIFIYLFFVLIENIKNLNLS
jgi:hypothetical protein